MWHWMDWLNRILNFGCCDWHTGDTRFRNRRRQPEARSRHLSVHVPGHSEHQDHASEAEEGLAGGMSVLACNTMQVWMHCCFHKHKSADGISTRRKMGEWSLVGLTVSCYPPIPKILGPLPSRVCLMFFFACLSQSSVCEYQTPTLFLKQDQNVVYSSPHHCNLEMWCSHLILSRA